MPDRVAWHEYCRFALISLPPLRQFGKSLQLLFSNEIFMSERGSRGSCQTMNFRIISSIVIAFALFAAASTSEAAQFRTKKLRITSLVCVVSPYGRRAGQMTAFKLGFQNSGSLSIRSWETGGAEWRPVREADVQATQRPSAERPVSGLGLPHIAETNELRRVTRIARPPPAIPGAEARRAPSSPSPSRAIVSHLPCLSLC